MNWDKIEQLLNICEASVKWPTLKGIHDAAMAELIKHALTKPQAEEPRPKPVAHREV